MKNIKRNLFILPALICLAAAPCLTVAETTSARFLLINPSPRAAALANAVVAACDDATAVYYNPSIMGFYEDTKFAFSYTAWLDGLSHFSSFATIPLGRAGTIGAGFLGLASGDILATSDAGGGNIQLTGTSVSAFDMCAMAAYSYPFLDSFSAGVTLKLIHERMENESATAFAADIGLALRHPLYRLKAAVVVQNLGTKPSFVSESFPLPLVVRLGGSYELWIGQRSQVFKSFLFALEGRYRPEEGLSGAGGLEINLANMFYLRGGYEYSRDNDSRGFKTGLGFRYNRFPIPYTRLTMQVDYGIDLFKSFSPTHFIQLKISYYYFGDKVSKEQRVLLKQADTLMSNISTYDQAQPDYSNVVKAVPGHIRSAYNIACIYAVKGDIPDTIKWLEFVIRYDHSYSMRQRITFDPDFDGVRDSEEFVKLMEKLDKK